MTDTTLVKHSWCVSAVGGRAAGARCGPHLVDIDLLPRYFYYLYRNDKDYRVPLSAAAYSDSKLYRPYVVRRVAVVGVQV